MDQAALTMNTMEAKNRLNELLRMVEAGFVITITKHRRPVAYLVPAEQQEQSK